MKRLRQSAVLLVVIEALVFAYISRNWLVPSLLIAAALVGYAGDWRMVAGPRWRTMALVAIGGAAGFWALLFPHVPTTGLGLFRFPTVAQLVGHGVMAFQVLQLYVRPVYDAKRIPMLSACWGLLGPFPFYGVVVFITAGDISGSLAAQHAFRVMSFAYVIAIACYLTALRYQRLVPDDMSRHVGRGVLAGLVALAIFLGSAGSTAMFVYGDAVDTAFSRLLARSSIVQHVGFSTSATLSSVTNAKSDNLELALRIRSEVVPAYMRGLAYDTYVEDEWTITSLKRLVPAVDPGDGLLAFAALGTQVFQVQEGRGDTPVRLDIWPDSSMPRGILFHPLNTSMISAPCELLLADEHDVPFATRLESGTPYTLQVEAVAAHAPTSKMLEALRAVPGDIDPRIRELAATVIGDTTSAEVAAARTVNYFRSEYDYALGIDVPNGARPIEYFLLERPAAHCEYFATGAVLMLRLAGFPARYATGFVVHEHNPVGDYWMARSRDAHAWVEVYDPVKGWFTVEPTPASGVPSGGGGYRFFYWLDYVALRWNEMIAAFSLEGIGGGLAAGLNMLSALGGGAVAALFAAAALYLLFHFRRKFRLPWRYRHQAGTLVEAPELAELHALLAERDQMLRRRGVERNDGETLHEFADRVLTLPELDGAEVLAAWYRAYALVRFRGTFSPEALRTLETADSSRMDGEAAGVNK